jgi:hypothetical protein
MAARIPKEGGSSNPRKEVDLKEMMKNLVLKDEELDDVVLPKEDFNSLREEARWMAVVKVHTTKHFGNQPFFQKMDVAWGFARTWTIRPVEDNLFILQVSCLGDWNRAMLEGPWIFRQQGVLLEPYDGIADPKTVILDRMHAWVQIRGVPPLFRKEGIVRDMAARIGEVQSVDLYAMGASGTSFVRLRMKLDVKKPLTRFVGLHPEGNERMHFQVMYEKLPRVCEVCGLFGHDQMECGDGVHEEQAKQYGSWMIAPYEDWHPQTPGLSAKTPANEGRRGGSGKADLNSRKRPQGSSPAGKPQGAKGPVPGMPLIVADPGQEGKVQGSGAKKNLELALRESAAASSTGGSPVKPDPKRPRKNGVDTEQAGSEEHRQEQ